MPDLPLVFLYIDPGIGFLALQMLSGALLGVVFYFRKATLKVLKHLRLGLRRKEAQEPKGLDNR